MTDDVEHELGSTLLPKFGEEKDIKENCEIINKLNIEIINDQKLGLFIRKLFSSVKVLHVHYDYIIFRYINHSELKLCSRSIMRSVI